MEHSPHIYIEWTVQISKMRDRGLHISVKKKYKPLVDFLAYYKKTMGANASELMCELASAGLTTEPWKTRSRPVLPPQQQKPEPVITGPRVKTEAEIREENERLEAKRILEEERKRLKALQIAGIKEYMKS